MNVCERLRQVQVREELYEVPCGSRYCPACGERWQGDMRVQAVAASEHVGSAVALITVTAPGAARLTALARHLAVDDATALDWWNRGARVAWRRFHLWARRPVDAWAREHAPTWRVLFRSWEYQARGALHLHLVLPFGTPAERRVTKLYVYNLWSGARTHGFGYVMGGEKGARPSWHGPPTVKPADGPAAARYVAKYVASTGAGKDGMVKVAQRTAQRGSVLYVSRTLTARTGITMTTLRARRRIYSRYPWARDGGAAWAVACVVDGVQRGRPPLALAAVETIRQAVSGTGTGFCVDAETGEVLPPTFAPAPSQDGRTGPPAVRGSDRVVLRLAPVLLRDPDAPWLGPTRTLVEVVTA